MPAFKDSQKTALPLLELLHIMTIEPTFLNQMMHHCNDTSLYCFERRSACRVVGGQLRISCRFFSKDSAISTRFTTCHDYRTDLFESVYNFERRGACCVIGGQFRARIDAHCHLQHCWGLHCTYYAGPGIFCRKRGRFCGKVGFFCRNTGLFRRNCRVCLQEYRALL